jgi:hypothetical protein
MRTMSEYQGNGKYAVVIKDLTNKCFRVEMRVGDSLQTQTFPDLAQAETAAQNFTMDDPVVGEDSTVVDSGAVELKPVDNNL